MINHGVTKSRILFFLLPIAIIVGVLSSLFILPAKLDAAYRYVDFPTLKATITPPGGNQKLKVGTNFTVTADIAYMSGDVDAIDVKATITVHGPAALSRPERAGVRLPLRRGHARC